MGNINDVFSVSDWFTDINSDFIIIGGPCSAESETQMLETAKALKNTGKVLLKSKFYFELRKLHPLGWRWIGGIFK